MIAKLNENIEDFLNSDIKHLLDELLNYSIDTFNHSIRTANIAYIFGLYLELDRDDLKNLCVGAILHDIGKIRMPKDILEKKDILTLEEISIIKTHPTEGYAIVSQLKNISKKASDIILEHQEKYNGTGYPRELKGEQISYLARITTICDSVDAMRSKRCYHDKYSDDYIISELNNNIGIQFDRELVVKFLEIFKEKIVPLYSEEKGLNL